MGHTCGLVYCIVRLYLGDVEAHHWIEVYLLRYIVVTYLGYIGTWFMVVC
jgi:hypothetical protein